METASPVEPVVPESPEVAVLESKAVALASPVSPVLVLLLWAVAAPEAPLVATGVMVRVAEPPSSPLSSPVATLAPPVANDGDAGRRRR